MISLLSGVLSVRPILLRDMLGQDRQKTYIISNGYFLCLSCPRAALALEQGEFMPRECLASKGPLFEMFLTSLKVRSEEKILQRIGLLPSFSEALKCKIKKTLNWKRADFIEFLGYGA